MDLSFLDTRQKSNTGAFMHLKRPDTGVKIYDPETNQPVGLMILGRDSDHFNKLNHAKNNARIQAKGDQEPLTSEAIEDENYSLLADLTVDWQNISFEGSTEFTRDRAFRFFKTYRWAYEQANEFAAIRANFI